MHPLLATRARLGLYALAWLPVGILVAALLVVTRPRPWSQALVFALPLALLLGFLALGAWWVCRAAPLGQAGAGRLLAMHGLAAVLTSLAWTASSAAWASGLRALALEGSGPRPAVPWLSDAPLLFVAGIVLFLLSSVVHYLLMLLEASREAERRALELQVLAREAELRALRAQIHPHFLFNSLNTIGALSGQDPAAARRACVLLADFLRRTLKVGEREAIPLAEELALVESYLAVEQARFGPRLTVNLSPEDGALSCLVPPLLLQPLVENAVSHGVARLVDGGVVRIGARKESGQLRIEIENPCDQERPAREGSGVGLRNVRARLAALHAGKARVDVRETPGRFHVELTLPVTASE